MHAAAARFWTHLTRLRGDRRGVTSVLFAGSAVAVVGTVALAADAGVLYAARRGAQNAADTAALAGALTLARADAAHARRAATGLSARNGFTEGGVTSIAVNIPPTSGANMTRPGAVEVIVRQQQALSFGRLLISTPPTVGARSVGALVDDREACMIALNGAFSLAGSTSVTAANCVLASNARSGPGFDVAGGTLSARSLSAVTTCSGCDSSGVSLREPYAEGQPAARNPFAALDNKALPRFGAGRCMQSNGRPTSLEPYETNGGRAYCSDIRVTGNDTLTLRPGTYYLNNASLIVLGTGSVTCPTCTGGAGVTIVLTGDPARVGVVDMAGTGNIALRAPSAPADPDFRGVLFYRDARAAANSTPNRLNGTSAMDLRGGMYFPTNDLTFAGTADWTNCGVVVASAISFTGNTSLTSGVGNCSDTGTAVPRTQVARLLE